MHGDVSAIGKLRTKYITRMLTADFNKYKSMVVKDFEAFRKLDILEETMLLQELGENRKKKEKKRVVDKHLKW